MQTRINTWLEAKAIDPADKDTIRNMSEEERNESFHNELEFGTGGLRGVLGLGSARMNIHNVRKATQAFLTVLSEQGVTRPIVVIGYDTRNFSPEFAMAVAQVVGAFNGTAYLYQEPLPVSFVSYGVRELKAHAGVMVTASHNPPKYNGYKLYWSDGGQVTPPWDQKVITAYNNITNLDSIRFNPNYKPQHVPQEVIDSYYFKLKGLCLKLKDCQENGDKLHIVYTPLHGTGLKPCLEILKNLGFTHVDVVEAQKKPDGSFPTVKSPNPENLDALQMAINLMKESKAELVFGTDPDCDRLGVVFKHSDGEFIALNGNQMAILMLHYKLSTLKILNQLPSNPWVIKTFVTSELQTDIAESFGATIENTLTGFKWMGKRVTEEECKIVENNSTSNLHFIFASEESFGAMPHSYTRDKDGVAAVALMAEVALFHKLNNRTLLDALDAISLEFGHAQESLLSFDFEGLTGNKKIMKIMEHFQNMEVNSLFAYDNIIKKEIIPQLPTPVIGLHFASGHRLWLRPSGTEPKIKFYSMTRFKKQNDLKLVKGQAKAWIEKIETEIRATVEKL